MHGVPKRTPRSGPNGAVPCMDLVSSVGQRSFLSGKIEDQMMELVLAVQKELLW